MLTFWLFCGSISTSKGVEPERNLAMKSFDIKKPVEQVESQNPSEVQYSAKKKRLLGWFSLESLKAVAYNKYTKVGAAILAIVAVGYGAKLAYESYSDRNQDTQVEENVCSPTWEMSGLGHKNGDFIEGGVNGIKEVNKEVDPKDILYSWLDQVDNDKTTLDFIAESFHKNGDKKIINIDKNSLVNEKGCATDAAVTEVNYIKDKIKTAKVNYGLAPVDGVNSYVTDKDEVGKSKVTEREAIIIDFGNGEKLYVVGICGNLVDEKVYTIIKETKEKKTIVKKKQHDKDDEDKNKKKSSNPKDYKKPGDDNKKDSGSGSKPKASVSTSAESTPEKTDKPSSTQPNEGGSSSGSVSD